MVSRNQVNISIIQIIDIITQQHANLDRVFKKRFYKRVSYLRNKYSYDIFIIIQMDSKDK